MAEHKVAWMPGDGTGKGVMEAARIVLDASGPDAEYIPGDVGWEFWCKEGQVKTYDMWEHRQPFRWPKRSPGGSVEGADPGKSPMGDSECRSDFDVRRDEKAPI